MRGSASLDQEGLDEDDAQLCWRNQAGFLRWAEAKRNDRSSDYLLYAMQGHAERAVRFIARICTEVAVGNRCCRDRNKGQDCDKNEHPPSAKVAHGRRNPGMLDCGLYIVKIILRLAPVSEAKASPS